MWAIALIMAFCAAVILHAIVDRTFPLGTAVSRFLVGGTVVGSALLIYSYTQWGFTTPFFSTAFAYAFLCEFYLFAITLVLSSISVNLVVQMRSEPFDREQLDQLYDSRHMVEVRINRLVDIGLLEVREGKLVATPAGRRVARSFQIVQRYFKHPSEPAAPIT